MNSAHIVQFETPQGLLLNGFWFGPPKPHIAYILIHGLSSNAFANHPLVTPLVDSRTAVFTFSNRGSEKITRFKKRDLRKKKGYSSVTIGEAHEVFTDCVDDIQGAVTYAQKQGAHQIILVGHSTGCQKAIHYLAQRSKQKYVAGVILLAPMSDYAGALKHIEKIQLNRATQYAEKLISQGKEHDLIPLDMWPFMHDAQRFLSLYTPESSEEIFCYVDPLKKPVTLQKVKVPCLIILAGKDEFRDRPIAQIAKWFQQKLRRKTVSIHIINQAPHNFFGFDQKVVSVIKNWSSPI